MKEKTQNKKWIYIIAVIVILLGILVTYMWKTNVSLSHTNHIRIDLYVGKEYKIDDLKQIIEEVFGKQEVIYQEIETFHDSVAIHLKEATQEELGSFKTRIAEKYEIEDSTNFMQVIELGNIRIRDMIKPYLIPMVITTLIILAYVGIRYLNLGIFKTIFTLLIRLALTQGILFSFFEIARIPVGVYTIPLALGIYILVTTMSVAQYEKQLAIKKIEDEK